VDHPGDHDVVQGTHVFILHESAVDELTRFVLGELPPLGQRHRAARDLDARIRMRKS
jgi:hypothetical protein